MITKLKQLLRGYTDKTCMAVTVQDVFLPISVLETRIRDRVLDDQDVTEMTNVLRHCSPNFTCMNLLTRNAYQEAYDRLKGLIHGEDRSLQVTDQAKELFHKNAPVFRRYERRLFLFKLALTVGFTILSLPFEPFILSVHSYQPFEI